MKPQLFIPAVICAAACLVTACESVPTDVVVTTTGNPQTTVFASYEGRLVELEIAPNAKDLALLRAELEKAAARPGLSRRVLARADALRAEAAFLAKDLPATRALATSAAAFSDSGEGAWRMRAALEQDRTRRLALLEQGIARADAPSRLLCERGRELLAAGRYAEAAQDLDEGLRGLAPKYGTIYGAERDKALSLARAGRNGGTAPRANTEAGLDAPLTLRTMVERTLSETRFLSALSSDPAPGFEAILPAVKAAGLLLDPGVPPETRLSRKQVAYFLWGIAARLTHDPKLLTSYRSKYAASPVADVPIDAPWFDAAIGVVEQEVMDLADGVHFRPDAPVTGVEYLGMLEAMKNRYR